MDLSIRTETFVQDSQKWLASKHGVDTAQGVTLDASKFASTMYPNGFIPSGTVVAKYASDSTVGPYDPNSGATAGEGTTALGILLEAVPVTSADATPSAALLKHCFVNADKMPFGTGATTKGAFDSAAQTDLAHVVVR